MENGSQISTLGDRVDGNASNQYKTMTQKREGKINNFVLDMLR